MNNKLKVGIFGGSFNPIQNSHLKLIKSILSKNLIDEIWIVPCKKHAFKGYITNDKHRVEMIKLAIKDPRVNICDVELKSDNVNYTIDTIKKLKEKNDYEFFWIAGSDILHEIKRWHNYKELFNEIKFIIFERKDYSIIDVSGMKIIIINETSNTISSTEIRNNIKLGKSLKNLIPLNVEEYIKKKGLYK